MTIDIIIFAIIAFVLAFRLWQVLGTRTGLERKDQDYANLRRAAAPASPTTGKNIDITVGEESQHALNALSANLAQIKNLDHNFAEGHFLRGARVAFEMIAKAFADGDKGTLKQLLDAALYDNFAKAIDERKTKGERMELTIVRLRDPDITDARIVGSEVYLTVLFKSEQITTTRDKDNKVIDGDPDRIYDINDIWTFRRNAGSSATNWYLTATQSHEEK
ncbi:MAG: Tim44 domain-containing protein [Alphaproteobacteria bacterium]|nr:MAG: Tim44 domain-containing protein [Alphaproteobacteria bacterium]